MQLITPTSAPLKQPAAVPAPPGAWSALDRAAGNASAHEVLLRRTGSALDGLDVKLVHERSLKWAVDALDGGKMTNGIAARSPETAGWYANDLYPAHGITDEIFASVVVSDRDATKPATGTGGMFGAVRFEFDPARVTPTGVLALNAYDALGWATRHSGPTAITTAMAEQLALRAGFTERLPDPPPRPSGKPWLIHAVGRDIDPKRLLALVDPATPEPQAVAGLRELLRTAPNFGIKIPAEAHLRVTPHDATRIQVGAWVGQDVDAVRALLGEQVPATPEATRIAVRDALAGRAELWGVPVE